MDFDINPGDGYLHYNNSNLSIVDKIWINISDINSISQAGWITTFDDSNTSSTRGYLTIATETINNIFLITGTVVAKGSPTTTYYEIPVQFISGTTRAAANSIVTVNFSRTGNSGTSGTSGTSGGSGAQGNKGGLQYEFDSATNGTGLLTGHWRVNSSTPSTLFISRYGIEGTSVDHNSFINAWADSNNSSGKGILIITGNSNSSTSYLILQVGSVTPINSNTAWQVGVTYLSGTLPSDATRCSIIFSRTGNEGQNGVSEITTYTNGSGTWTKPSGVSKMDVILIGGGGGGGSGAVGTVGTTRRLFGGGGGGGGAIVFATLLASDYGTSISYQVGAGGPGGAPVQNNNANSDGINGTSGGKTYFGRLIAPGGVGGDKGVSNTNATVNVPFGGPGAGLMVRNTSNTDWGDMSRTYPFGVQYPNFTSGLSGGNAYNQNTTGNAVDWVFGCTGGGGGGGYFSVPADANYTGGNGGSIFASNPNGTATNNYATAIYGINQVSSWNGGISSNQATASAGTNYSGSLSVKIGLGGAGGWMRNGLEGARGGNGGIYGGGGGGGGASVSSNSRRSGAGGNGASGIIIIIAY